MSHFGAVMPEHCSRLDHAWIQEQLESLPYRTRLKVAQAYDAVYQQTFDAETVSYRKENAARRAANIRLRIFISSFAAATVGATEQPPIAG
ncbi:hypothetical protein DK750_19335 [Salmonella enterica subsp. enterica serovar Rovaniemi]|nr:hypothetical protein [Salmonella enterica subsp. enterica serovar Aba]EBU7766959.1 hypothetical protein [Salmonella enterica subsp. enterica serovar Rovaniemi]ECQ1752818.1 hypothetical protein [Salmonella enterica subsp. enterica serovar Malstatt]EEI6239116.1 hypothetical protein [Salmonella enterica subsp. enterica serovar Tudu]EGC2275414.1 hypothetical protein [Salmonella enterica subsp. enterica serovar Agbeni]